LTLALSVACRVPAASPVELRAQTALAPARDEEPGPQQQPGTDAEPEPELNPQPYDLRSGGISLRALEGDRNWGAVLALPVSVGWTGFDLDIDDLSIGDLSTVAIVPTVEGVVPLGDHWTLLPFVGLGGAWQVGDNDLIGGDNAIGLAAAGVRATKWQPFEERYSFLFTAELRYDAALVRRNGLLGDWGSVDAALELRRVFGAARAGPAFQGGVYLQGTRFWDPVELEIVGVTPATVERQAEVGISLGTTAPFKILGIGVPRTFVGYRFGDDLRGLRIRFGRL